MVSYFFMQWPNYSEFLSEEKLEKYYVHLIKIIGPQSHYMEICVLSQCFIFEACKRLNRSQRSSGTNAGSRRTIIEEYENPSKILPDVVFSIYDQYSPK